jgi:hypothetical protein
MLVMSLVDDGIAMNPVQVWTGYTLEESLRLIAWITKCDGDIRRSKPVDDFEERTGPREYSLPGPEDGAQGSPALCDEVPDDFHPEYFSFDSGDQLSGDLRIGSCPAPGIVVAIHNSTQDVDWARSMFGENVLIEMFREQDDYLPDQD